MKKFNIANLWQNKQKNSNQKNKAMSSPRDKATLIKDEWDMTPEDALRKAYSGHK